MREHGIMRLSKGRSANYVIQNVHIGIQSKGSHRGSPRGEKSKRDCLKAARRKEEALKKEKETMLKTIGQLTIERDFLQDCFRRSGYPVPELDSEKR